MTPEVNPYEPPSLESQQSQATYWPTFCRKEWDALRCHVILVAMFSPFATLLPPPLAVLVCYYIGGDGTLEVLNEQKRPLDLLIFFRSITWFAGMMTLHKSMTVPAQEYPSFIGIGCWALVMCFICTTFMVHLAFKEQSRADAAEIPESGDR